MQFIYSMPFWSCPPNPAFLSQDAIIALSVAAEEAGFAAVSFTEHPIPDESWRITGGHDGLDPFIGLAIAAAVTKKLRLLTYLCVLPYRNPFLLAKTVATLDVLSGGRLILGAGVGYQEAEYAALGVDYAERNALFDEALEAMKLAWTGETPSPPNLDRRQQQGHPATGGRKGAGLACHAGHAAAGRTPPFGGNGGAAWSGGQAGRVARLCRSHWAHGTDRHSHAPVPAWRRTDCAGRHCHGSRNGGDGRDILQLGRIRPGRGHRCR